MIKIIIFDEREYGKKIMRSGYYSTLKWQGKERRALARYLKYDLGYNDFEIKRIVSKIKSRRHESYDEEDFNFIMNKLLENYDKGEYIQGIRIGVSQTELDIILDQPTTELRNLLWVMTVYYKWARQTKDRLCRRGDDEWVKEADLDLCRIAGLGRLRKEERNHMFHILYANKLYCNDFIRRYHNIFTLPFIDDKKPVIIVDSYEDILAHLESYLDENSCMKCSVCKSLIIKITNNQKYCSSCRSIKNHKKNV